MGAIAVSPPASPSNPGQPAEPLPELVAPMLAKLLAAGDEAVVGTLLAGAAELDDARLADFLDHLSNRIMESPEPVTASEVARLLADVEPPV